MADLIYRQQVALDCEAVKCKEEGTRGCTYAGRRALRSEGHATCFYGKKRTPQNEKSNSKM